MSCVKRLNLLVLALLLLQLVFSFSLLADVTLTNEEYEMIVNSLTIAQEELKISEEKRMQSEIESMQAWKLVEQHEITINLLKLNLSLLSESSKQQKIDKFLNDLKWFAIGTATGGALGTYGGFKLGVMQ